ncbi:anthocyanin 3'-O-beta-glucosyltransferase-like [Canna indica]|uniref:Glycosyltransferase n=1 Tax=Canna indica TaxID=4628 RepID=A0AAQ3QKA5_9LILI|nr:anthocyanin 3'-O-beta-glucosyltransferase-like [Canna indica]
MVSVSKADDLHIFFLPFLAPGHMIPMVDLARIFADRGVKASVVTTTGNIPLIQSTVDLANADPSLRHHIQILPLHLSFSDAGIPQGYENLTAFRDTDVVFRFASATCKLEAPFSQLLHAHRPDCIVADIFYPWASRQAKDLGIPLLLFHGSSLFQTVSSIVLRELKLDEITEETFELPGLPHRIRISLSELPEFVRRPPEFLAWMSECARDSHGMIMNSFYELEREYIDLARRSNYMKYWFVGPVSLHNRHPDEKIARGNMAASVSSDQYLKWLDSKKRRSVLYVCFGSLCRFTAAQLHEIARGLEASGQPFIWVVRHAGEPAEWMPEGFEKRVIGEGKGLIIHGWAPQLLILNHEAVGGFVTHCGWNSCLEAVTAGVPVITWPLFADQFFNEKLLVDVQGIGIAIGATVCSDRAEERVLVKEDRIKKAVNELMGDGKEAEERRRKAKELGVMARKAMEEGGSSYLEMSGLMEDLVCMKLVRLTKQM